MLTGRQLCLRMLTTKQQINMIQKVELTVCAGVSGKQKVRDDTLNHDRIKTNATNRLDKYLYWGLTSQITKFQFQSC